MGKQYIITEVAARPGFFCVHDFMLNNGGPPVIQSDFLKCHIIAPHSCPSPEAGATVGNPQHELIGRDVLGKVSLHSESAYRAYPYPFHIQIIEAPNLLPKPSLWQFHI